MYFQISQVVIFKGVVTPTRNSPSKLPHQDIQDTEKNLKDLQDIQRRTRISKILDAVSSLYCRHSSSHIWSSQKIQSDLGLQEQKLNLILETLLFTDSSSHIWSSQKIQSDLGLQEQKLNLILETLLFTDSSSHTNDRRTR